MANDGFIEFLSPNALAELKQAQALVDSLALKIEQISKFKAPSTPSGVNSASKQIIDDLKAQEAQLKAINDQLIRNEKLKQQVLASEAKQSNATKANIALQEARRKAILAQQQADEKAAKAAERSALANERLNDAYGKLNRSRNEAARVLQNLIASETASNAEIKKAQKEFDVLNAKVKKADQAVGNFSRNVGNYGSVLSGATQLMSAFGIATGVFLAVDIAKSIFQTTKELQSLDLALKNVSGNQVLYAENQIFIKKTAEDFGIEIKGLQEQFTQFYVAAKDKLSGEQIQNIFRSISKAGASMGLSVESQNSAFLALQQMMSKGTVQAEELKKQLGNALPGAFNIMAEALGVTERKMMEMMKAGKILSEDALPKFAIALEKAYGIENINRVETLAAAQERLANSWTGLIREMTEGDSIISKLIQGSFSLLQQRLESMTIQLKLFQFSWNETFGNNNKTTEKNRQVNAALEDYKNLSKELNIAIENRDKELKKLNQLEKIEEKVSGNRKIQAQADIETSKEKLKYLNLAIEVQKENLSTTKAEKLLEVNKKIADQEERYALITQKSLKIKELRDTKDVNSDEWTRLNNKIIENNKKVEVNNKLLAYNYALRFKLTEVETKKKTPPVTDETGDGDGETKIKKAKKDKIALNFKEIESEYNLRIAILERKKAENADDDQTSYEERIAKRIAFSEASIEIIDMQLQKEAALIKFKRDEDYAKNDLALKNKEISLEQHSINQTDIINTYINKNLTAEIKASDDIKALQKQDFNFFKSIKYKQQDEVLKLNKLITTGEIAKYKIIVDNENKTLVVREAAFQAYIQLEKDLLEAQKLSDIQRAESRGASKEEIKAITAEYENAIAALGNIKSPKILAIEQVTAEMKQVAQSFASDAGFGATFKLLQEGLDKYGDNALAKTVVIAEAFQEMFNFINAISQRNFEAEKQRLEEQTNIALAFAGESDTAKAEIERQAEARRKEIAAREFKAKKKQAIFNIAIDTAQAIIAIWAQVPKVDFGVSAGLLSAFVGALGAAQIAMVNSQEVPAYKMGTDNHKGGAMLVNDGSGSNYKETIQTPDGKIYQPKERNVLMNAPKGTKVFTHDQWQKNLDNILTTNSIGYAQPNVVVNSGMSDEQVNRIVSTIQNKQEYHQTFDKSGIKNYISNGHTTKEILNNQVTFGR
jgi:tape measure domain-containing protein